MGSDISICKRDISQNPLRACAGQARAAGESSSPCSSPCPTSCKLFEPSGEEGKSEVVETQGEGTFALRDSQPTSDIIGKDGSFTVSPPLMFVIVGPNQTAGRDFWKSPPGIPSPVLLSVSTCIHRCWPSRAPLSRWARKSETWPSWLRHLPCRPSQGPPVAAACLSGEASGPSSILALPTARCLPTTPSSSRNQAGAAPTRPRTPTADWEPSRCTSQASSQARARVGLELWESLRRVSPGCIPAQRTCPAVWTVLLHPGTTVSDLGTAGPNTHSHCLLPLFKYSNLREQAGGFHHLLLCDASARLGTVDSAAGGCYVLFWVSVSHVRNRAWQLSGKAPAEIWHRRTRRRSGCLIVSGWIESCWSIWVQPSLFPCCLSKQKHVEAVVFYTFHFVPFCLFYSVTTQTSDDFQ